MRLAAVHAVHFTIERTRRAPAAVLDGRFAEFRAAFLERFRSGETLAPPPGGRDTADT
jgi:queuine/archaeosine tRNA-ribosyltransferase